MNHPGENAQETIRLASLAKVVEGSRAAIAAG